MKPLGKMGFLQYEFELWRKKRFTTIGFVYRSDGSLNLKTWLAFLKTSIKLNTIDSLKTNNKNNKAAFRKPQDKNLNLS